MRWLVLCIAVLAIVGCDSPSPRFAGLVAKQITLEGSTFTVRHTAFEAEVIRTNAEANPRRADILRKAVSAIRQTSGCAILPGSVQGDTNVVRADLRCPGADEALRPARPTKIDCFGYEDRFLGGGIELECEVW